MHRKLFHFLALLFPAIYYLFLKYHEMLLLLTIFLAGSMICDIMRFRNVGFSKFFNRAFRSLLKKSELEEGGLHILGSTYFAVSCLIIVMFFSKNLAIIAITVHAVSDPIAYFLGTRFGANGLLDTNKSMFGFISYFVSALVISSMLAIFLKVIPSGQFFSPLLIMPIVMASAAASIAELFGRGKLDDNLIAPLAFACAFILF